MRRGGRLLWLVALCMGVLAAAPARALESAAARTARTTATLVSDRDAVAPGEALHLGLRLRMAPGWHIYWKNPGDAGVPPRLEWTLPHGVAAGPIAWPTPTRNAEPPLMTYGYAGEVMLPVAVTGTGAGPLDVKLHASWLVCDTICVPEEAELALHLPAGAATPSPQAPLFAAAAADTPRPAPWPATIGPDGTLRVTAPEAAAAVRAAWFIPDRFGTVKAAAPQTLRQGIDGFTLALATGSAFKPDAPLSGVLVLRDRDGQQSALEVRATPGPSAAAPLMPLWQILGFAMLGGLILNLMPCVFPVLAMKAAGLARLSGAARGHARMHALSYTAGVVLTFTAVGLALLVARAAGAAAGWGFQFQSPVFVAGMAWLLFAVGLNLSGVFEIGSRATGAGGALAGRGGHAGSFFTGMLAVLVATPCTAPFMGAAIAAALAGTPAMTVVVFAAMGLGLAAPFLLLAAVPAVAQALPRPGAWMDVLKQVLAFPMYAACVWLVWVVSQQSGPDGVLAAAAGLLLTGFAAWAFGLSQRGIGGRGAQAGALAAVLLAGAILSGIQVARPNAAPVAEAGREPFSAARLASLRGQGKPVFVDMTAAWCVSCLVNERVALSTRAVRDAFARRGVTYLRGDWTRQDPTITTFLRAHGRDGVPLYVLYPPGGGPGVVLPQVLTEGIVLNALDQMGA
jgi:thiol:disulfide interchange protein DsbD